MNLAAATTGIFIMRKPEADSWFSHIAMNVPGTEKSNEWLEPVEDAVYNRLETQQMQQGKE